MDVQRLSAAVKAPGGKAVSRKPSAGNQQPIPIKDQAPSGKPLAHHNPARHQMPDLSLSTPPPSAKRKVEPRTAPPANARIRPAG